MSEKLLHTIDINADLGEGIGLDAQIMPYISSCSIACGGHFGDESSMVAAIKLAKKHQVKVGAHPSFPDKKFFGRNVLPMTQNELKQTVIEQLSVFYALCERQEVTVNHIKLHGALYNLAATNDSAASAVIEAILACEKSPILYVQHGSVLHKRAENLLPLQFEAFIDRSYNTDLSLVSREVKEAMITNSEKAWEQLYDIVVRGVVTCINSEEKEIIASTFCVHGDQPQTVPILIYIHEQMNNHSIRLL